MDLFLDVLYFNKQILIFQFFHVFLGYLLHTATNKNEIINYFNGIIKGEKLNNIKVIKLLNSNDNFKNEIELNNLIKKNNVHQITEDIILSYIISKKKGNIHIEEYNNSISFYNTNFPDCGETSLRNFFKIVLYNNQKDFFDYNRLIELKAIPILILYFYLFSKNSDFIEKLNIQKVIKTKKTTKKEIISKINGLNKFPFSDQDTPETAWLKIVENLKSYKVKYNRSLTHNNKIIQYEIYTGMNLDDKNPIPNMLAVIKNIFQENKEITESNDINKVFNFIIGNNGKIKSRFDNKVGLGTFEIIPKNIKNIFKFYFSKGHYYITRNYYDDSKLNVIENYIQSYNKQFMYKKINDDNIHLIMEENTLNENIYYNMFAYCLKRNNEDLLHRLSDKENMNIELLLKILKISKLDLLDKSIKYNYFHIIYNLIKII